MHSSASTPCSYHLLAIRTRLYLCGCVHVLVHSLCCDSDKAVCESCSLAKVALHGPGTEHVRVCDTCADVFLSASLQGFSI